MDKLDIILEKLDKLESVQEEIRNSQDRMESDILALRMDSKGVHRKLDAITSAVVEAKEDITMLKAQ